MMVVPSENPHFFWGCDPNVKNATIFTLLALSCVWVGVYACVYGVWAGKSACKCVRDNKIQDFKPPVK